MTKLDDWRKLPPEKRYPTDIEGVDERLAHLRAATGLSNRAIGALAKQRLTLFGESIPLDVHCSLATGTINNLSEPGYRANVRTLESLEVVTGAPEGYFRSPIKSPPPQPETPRDRRVALIAHRLRGMDDTAVDAVERIIARLDTGGTNTNGDIDDRGAQ